MMKDKVVVVYGAAGSIGSEAARFMARDGALIHCVGRRIAPLELIADAIVAGGGQAHAFELDATDEGAVREHLAEVVEKHGHVDAVFNAISPALEVKDEVQPSVDIELESFQASLSSRALAQFITAREAARHMLKRGRGTIVFLSATPARGVAAMMAGDSAGFAAVEGLTRSLAREWGPHGVRVSCVRSGGMLETPRIQEVLSVMASFAGAPVDEVQKGAIENTLSKRLPTVAETAGVVSFLASDRAATLNGTIINSSCGEVVD